MAIRSPDPRRTSGLGVAVRAWFQPWPGAEATSVTADARVAVQPAVTPNSALRVLVVDDNPSNLMIASAQLQQCGITAVLASDGAEAVERACATSLDLILMDIQMPVMNGLTACARIRRFESQHARPRTPVVAYSSSEVGQDARTASGIDDALAKPCTTDELEACLARWCANYRPWPARPAFRGRSPQPAGDADRRERAGALADVFYRLPDA